MLHVKGMLHCSVEEATTLVRVHKVIIYACTPNESHHGQSNPDDQNMIQIEEYLKERS